MKRIGLLVTFLTGLNCATAEITPMIIKVSSTTNAFVDIYTVPAGKVLLIENYTIYAFADKIVRLYKDSDVVPLSPQWTTQTPLKIPEGWTIKIDKVTQGTTYYAYLFCLLVDPTDLFAYVPNNIKSFTISGSSAGMLVNLASSRQSRLAVEQSDDLKEWRTASAEISRQDSQAKNQYLVAIDSTNNVQFFRTVARARK